MMKRGSTLESPDCNLINVENKKRRIVLQSHRGTPLWHRDEEGKPDCLAELFFFPTTFNHVPRTPLPVSRLNPNDLTPSQSVSATGVRDGRGAAQAVVQNGASGCGKQKYGYWSGVP